MADVQYPIVIRQLADEDGGGFAAFVPDLYGCTGDGETEQEALADAHEAIVEWIDEAKRLGREIPAPGTAETRIREHEKAVLELIKKQDEVVTKQDVALKKQAVQFDRLREEIESLRSALECRHERDRPPAPWDVMPLIAAKAKEPNLPH